MEVPAGTDLTAVNAVTALSAAAAADLDRAARADGLLPPSAVEAETTAPAEVEAPTGEPAAAEPAKVVEKAEPGSPAEPAEGEDYDEETYALPPTVDDLATPTPVAAPVPTPAAAPEPAKAVVAAPVEVEETHEQIEAAHAEIAKQLYKTDAHWATVVNHLGGQRELVEAHQATINACARAEQELAERINARANVIADLEADLKDSPDDSYIREKLVARKDQQTFDRQELFAKKQDRATAGEQKAEAQRLYNEARQAVQGVIEHHYRESREAQTRENTRKAENERTTKEWPVALKRFVADNKIPKELVGHVNRILANAARTSPELIKDYQAWMSEQKWAVEGLRTHERVILANYSDLKREDAIQPAPKGQAAVIPSTPRKKAPTVDEVVRAAGQRMSEATARR